MAHPDHHGRTIGWFRPAAGILSAGLLLLAALAAPGCGPGLPTFTSDLREGRTVQDLQQLQFFVSADVELVSQKKGKLVGEPPFQTELKTRLLVSRETPGAIVAAESGWLVIDFGQGILLTFRIADNNTYVMPSWGSVTVDGERFDVNMGVLAGTHIVLHYRPAPPSAR